MKYPDPLLILYESYGVDIALVKDFFAGKKYAYVVLENGNIGISANIENSENFDISDVKKDDFGSYRNRLFLLAYFNALLNYNGKKFSEEDIFNIIDFSLYENIVMIGYSEPMYKKFSDKIKPAVFDYSSDEPFIKKQNLMPEYLKKSDVLILTGTSIINNTFSEIIAGVSPDCDVCLVGPSVTLSEDILRMYGLKGIFGTLFRDNVPVIADFIKDNFGTDILKKYGEKVALIK